MAFIFKDWRPRIAMRMAKGDKELMRWLNKATFAKTSNGYWLAWHQGDNVDRVALLPPEHPDGFVLNLFIQNPETGEWE